MLPADPAAIERAAQALRRGALVAFPTETVYGLGADATDPVALAAIFACKGRPADHPLIVHLAAAADLARWVGALPDEAHQLAEAFWPGPLTLVLPWPDGVRDAEPGVARRGEAARAISPVATGHRPTIGLRVPDHPVALALLGAVGRPVAAPSANRFGRVSPTTAAHVAAEFAPPSGADVALLASGPGLAVILDGGPCRVGVESTIVELVDQPTLLRAGGVPSEAIETVLGRQLLAASGPSRASGMLASHYAPRARVVVVIDLDDLAATVAVEGAARRRVAVLGLATRPAGLAAEVVLLGPVRDTDEYAKCLYHCLREADRRGLDVVVASLPSRTRSGSGRGRPPPQGRRAPLVSCPDPSPGPAAISGPGDPTADDVSKAAQKVHPAHIVIGHGGFERDTFAQSFWNATYSAADVWNWSVQGIRSGSLYGYNQYLETGVEMTFPGPSMRVHYRYSGSDARNVGPEGVY